MGKRNRRRAREIGERKFPNESRAAYIKRVSADYQPKKRRKLKERLS